MTTKDGDRVAFEPTHAFTLLDGSTVLVVVDIRGDPVAFEQDGTRWHTVCGVFETWWTCAARGVKRVASVAELDSRPPRERSRVR